MKRGDSDNNDVIDAAYRLFFFLIQAIIPSLTFIFRSVSINEKRPIVVYLLLAS